MRFEPFSEAHLDGVAELLDDPDTLRFTRVPEPPPPDFPREWLGRYEEGRKDGSREGFAAIGDDGDFLGLALVTFSRDEGEAELGYVVPPAARGRGVATEMLRRLTELVFDEGIERAVLIVDVANPASSKVAERAGYVREGVMRSVQMKPGRRGDGELWSRLPSDTGPPG